MALKRSLRSSRPSASWRALLVAACLTVSSAQAQPSAQPRQEVGSDACRREVWLVVDCSGSMFVPNPAFANVIEFEGQKRNLLEVSALVIDESLRGLDPNTTARVFCFYTSTGEVPLERTGRSLFRYLDSSSDGRIQSKDDPGGFGRESKTNLFGALDSTLRALAAQPADPRRATGIVIFTDGDADYLPPGVRQSGGDYAVASCKQNASAYAEILSSRNAVVNFVGLRPNLKDARRLAEECMAPVAGERVKFLPLGRSVSQTIQEELSATLAALSRLDVELSALTRKVDRATAALGVSNRWCSDVGVDRAALTLTDAAGRERQFTATLRRTFAAGRQEQVSAEFELTGLGPGIYDARTLLVDAAGRELGRSGGQPARLVEEHVSWSIEGLQNGLWVTGRLSVEATVGTKTTAKLEGYVLKDANGRTARVPAEASVWDLVPPEGSTQAQNASFEFRFALPQELRGTTDTTITVEPEITLGRELPVKAAAVRFRHDPAMGLAEVDAARLVYNVPVVEQAAQAIEEQRESGPVWLVPLRVVKNRLFLGDAIDLDQSALILPADGGRRQLPNGRCPVGDGQIGHWTLTAAHVVAALEVEAVGTLELGVELRSTSAQVGGTTRIKVVRPAPLVWTLRDLDVPRPGSSTPSTWQVVVSVAADRIPPMRDGSLVGIESERGLVVAGPYFREATVKRVVEASGGTLLKGDDLLPVYWLKAVKSLDPRVTSAPHTVAFTCENYNDSRVRVSWTVAGQAMPGRFRSGAVAEQHFQHDCTPGLSTGTFELRTDEDLALVRLALAGATGAPGSLPVEVRVPTGEAERRMLDGWVWLVAERSFAWGLLGLIVVIGLSLAAGAYEVSRRLRTPPTA